MNQTYHSYEEITSVPDRLRWLRHSKGLMQREAAEMAGVSRTVYNAIECGTTAGLPKGMAERLAGYYGVPVSDLLDEYNRFLYDGQAKRIRAYRKRLGLGRKLFCQAAGIPLTSLRYWENGEKTVSLKSWEQYFRGRA